MGGNRKRVFSSTLIGELANQRPASDPPSLLLHTIERWGIPRSSSHPDIPFPPHVENQHPKYSSTPTTATTATSSTYNLIGYTHIRKHKNKRVTYRNCAHYCWHLSRAGSRWWLCLRVYGRGVAAAVGRWRRISKPHDSKLPNGLCQSSNGYHQQRVRISGKHYESLLLVSPSPPTYHSHLNSLI